MLLGMAGGMSFRRGPSLSERFGLEPAAEPPAAGAPEPPPRHCWVADPPGHPGSWPGVLLAWERVEGGWRGRVVYVARDGDDAVLVETWLPAAVLRPSP